MNPPMHIYSCAEWQARPVDQVFAVTDPTDMVLHHMDWPNRPLITATAEAVSRAFQVARQCQADHMDNNGWSDTGQNFTITREGIVLEGRHGSLAALLTGHSVRAAHAADPDTGADDNNSPGTEHEGTYVTDEMPAAQWNASVQFHAWMSHQLNMDTAMIKGHRQTGCQTDCPGDWFESQIPRFRLEAHQAKLKLV